jgi:hypothetical protein
MIDARVRQPAARPTPSHTDTSVDATERR